MSHLRLLFPLGTVMATVGEYSGALKGEKTKGRGRSEEAVPFILVCIPPQSPREGPKGRGLQELRAHWLALSALQILNYSLRQPGGAQGPKAFCLCKTLCALGCCWGGGECKEAPCGLSPQDWGTSTGKCWMRGARSAAAGGPGPSWGRALCCR